MDQDQAIKIVNRQITDLRQQITDLQMFMINPTLDRFVLCLGAVAPAELIEALAEYGSIDLEKIG